MIGLFRKKHQNPASELKSLLGSYNLPSFSVTVMNVLNLLRNPDSSMKDISDQLEVDPGMHVEVLKTVNSAAFGLISKVSSISHAVSLLGRSRLESIVLAFAVKDSLPNNSGGCFDSDIFWKVSSQRASLARALAKRLHPSTAAESFSAGLLQDMAIPVIAEAKGDKYCSLLNEWNSDMDYDITVMEKEAFGFDHTVIGSLISTKWELPDYLHNAISDHHNANADEIEPAINIVSMLRYDLFDECTDLLKKHCVDEFNFSSNEIDELVDSAIADAAELIQ